jgi:hypothetical protein
MGHGRAFSSPKMQRELATSSPLVDARSKFQHAAFDDGWILDFNAIRLFSFQIIDTIASRIDIYRHNGIDNRTRSCAFVWKNSMKKS